MLQAEMLTGPQWPPFSLVPDSYTTAAARELADFAKMIGQPGDEWQSNSLQIGCGERQDGTWAAQEVAILTQRQNGKGWIPETRGLGGLYLFGERLIYYTAHNIDTAKMTFDRCVELVEGFDDLRRRVKRINNVNSQEAIELVGGAEMRFRTRGRGRAQASSNTNSGGKGRGFSCDCLFLDEALYLQQDALDALLPTMLARPNPQIWYLSTPPVSVDAALMKIRDDGLAGVPNMAMALWANKHGADLTDERVLAFGNPAWGIRLNLEVMAVLRRRLGEAGFARECGGIWPERGAPQWQLFPEAAWNDRKDPDAQPAGRPALAVDVTPDRSTAAINAAAPRAGGGRLVDVFEHRPGGGVRWVLGALKELDQRYDPLVIVINDKALADEAEQAGLTVHRASAGDVAAGAAALYDGIAGPDLAGRDVWHKGRPELTDAAGGAVPRTIAGTQSWALDRSDPTVDISPMVGGSIALWALGTPRIHRPARRVPAAAWADVSSVVPAGSRPVRRPAGRRGEAVDVSAQRLAEQIERDLAMRS